MNLDASPNDFAAQSIQPLLLCLGVSVVYFLGFQRLVDFKRQLAEVPGVFAAVPR